MTETLTRVTVPTVVLKDLVARGAKGSSNVDVIPMSSLMQVKQSGGKLVVNTTDNINYLTTFAEVDAADFEFVVQTKGFAQIISKLTSVDTTFVIEGTKIEIIANGKYAITAVTDANGASIVFPSVEVVPSGNTYHVQPEEIKSVLSLNKACRAEKNEIPAVMGNYVATPNNVITSNYYKACMNPVIMTDETTLISNAVMELVSVVADESGVDVSQNADYIVFESTRGRLVGKKDNSALSTYPVDALANLMSTDLADSVQLNRTQFVQAVDRMCLFVDTYEQNRLSLSFTAEGLELSSAKTGSSETINYISASSVTPASFSIDGIFLKTELASCDKEDLTVRYSSDAGLQIKCGDVVLMLGILGDSEDEEI